MSEASGKAQGEPSYGLPEIFAALRADFIASQAALAGGDKKPLMQVSEAQIELSFTLDRATTGGGGVNLKFFGVGFEAKGEKARTEGTAHKLTVKLVPVEGMDTGVLGGLPRAE